MKPNMGTVDEVVRILAGLVFAVLYFTHGVSGTPAIILLLVAGIFILTSFISFCPLYLPLDISTRKKEK